VTTTFRPAAYGLTGPNGAGKSTFMKLLTGGSRAARTARPAKIGVLRQDQCVRRVIDTVAPPPVERPRERELLYAKSDDAEACASASRGHRRRRDG
jgi:ATPase subunit of ABC transporter with duplicated ATPase domains